MHPKPKKTLGQNFLVDQNIQKKIFSSCQIKKDDLLLEIGPGRGEITSYLLSAKPKRLIAIEIDRELCKILRRRFSFDRGFELINQDILTLNLSQIIHNPKQSVKVIGNIPYYISTPLISHLLENRKSVKALYLTLQKELARRLVAKAGSKDYSAFSCLVQYYTKPKVLFAIKRDCFWPAPKVDSCLVRLEVLSEPATKAKDEELFFRIIRKAFNQRRKAIRNSLKGICRPDKLIRNLSRLKLDQMSRAEDLTLKNYADLSNLLSRRT